MRPCTARQAAPVQAPSASAPSTRLSLLRVLCMKAVCALSPASGPSPLSLPCASPACACMLEAENCKAVGAPQYILSANLAKVFNAISLEEVTMPSSSGSIPQIFGKIEDRADLWPA